jgi:hypothetical protein
LDSSHDFALLEFPRHENILEKRKLAEKLLWILKNATDSPFPLLQHYLLQLLATA